MTIGMTRYLPALPLAAVLGVFLLVPMVTLVVVSFFDYDSVQIIPGFVLTNYRDVLFSATTWWTYLETLKFTAIVWALTLLIGFWVAYFLTFVVASRTVQTTLFLVCTVPFLTSNIIRMISWVPFLGRNARRWSSCCSPTSPWCWRSCTSTRCSWWRRSSTPWCASTAA
jgi:putative spermidine/putrescine transport system permease protein